jgi:hypothetical protein
MSEPTIRTSRNVLGMLHRIAKRCSPAQFLAFLSELDFREEVGDDPQFQQALDDLQDPEEFIQPMYHPDAKQ